MRAVTLVPTNGYLFAGTLRDNLLLAQPDATDAELLRALDRTRVAAFVQANGGLDMVINEGGTNLSGGQRQRVCMARALLHDSPIYVFDEATSNVDAASEAAIGEVIASLAGEHTVIVVAHRLSTIVDADQILVLERGRIAERGTHDELLSGAGAMRACGTVRSSSRHMRMRRVMPRMPARLRLLTAAPPVPMASTVPARLPLPRRLTPAAPVARRRPSCGA